MDSVSHPISGKRSVPVIKTSRRRLSRADSSCWTTFQKACKVVGEKDSTGDSHFYTVSTFGQCPMKAGTPTSQGKGISFKSRFEPSLGIAQGLGYPLKMVSYIPGKNMTG